MEAASGAMRVTLWVTLCPCWAFSMTQACAVFCEDLLSHFLFPCPTADAIKGTPPGGLVSAAAGAVGRHVYLFGGFSGHVHDEMYRVTLPTNFCNTILRRSECTSTIGCSWCQLHSVLGNVTQPTNQSACYPVGQSVPAVCHAVVNITLVEFENGSACNSTVFARRACDTYHQCSACVASFPGAHGASGSCQWCYGCSNDGKCVSPGTNCDQVIRDPGCRYMPWTKPEQCIENGCEASTCAECTSQAKPKCVWTPQLLWKADGWRTVGGDYPWSCFLESTSKKPNVRLDIVSPPQPCPAPCTRHADCQSCLNSKGILLCLGWVGLGLAWFCSGFVHIHFIVPSFTLHYSTLLYSTLLYSTPLHSTPLYSTLLYSTLLYSTLLYSTLLYSTLLYFTLLYYTLFYPILLYSALLYSTLLYSTLLHSTLLHSILPYSTLLCSTSLYSTPLYSTLIYSNLIYSTLF